jgi:hypothetical protein
MIFGSREPIAHIHHFISHVQEEIDLCTSGT